MLLRNRWSVRQTLQHRVPYRLCTQAIDPNTVRGRVFKKLFKKGAPRTMEALVNHLCRLAREGDVDTCWDLLEEGCDPNRTDKDGWTPLLYAAARGHEPVVSLLLDRGAKPDSTDKDCLTALMAAVDNDNHAVVRTLVHRGADVQCVNKIKRSPLHLACSVGRIRNAALLMDVGADVNCTDMNGWTPLHFAANKGNSDVVRALLRTGAKADAKNKFLETPLHLAVSRGNWATAALLLRYGADPDAKNKDGWTPLHFAAYWGHDSCSRILLRANADPHATDKAGKTALRIAQESGHDRFSRSLEMALKKGKRPEHKTILPDVSDPSGVQVVHLDVGHQRYVTCKETLTYIPGSYFWMAFNPATPIPPEFEPPEIGSLGPGPGKELTLKSDNHLVIDRNPKMFDYVIDYLRTIVYTKTKAFELPEDKYEMDELLREARFYRVPPMIAKILEETEFKLRKTLRNAMSPKRRRKVMGGRALYKPEKPSALDLDKIVVDDARRGGDGGNDTEFLESDEV